MKHQKLYSLVVLFLASWFSLLAQEKTISGLVKDVSGAPIPEVNVVVKGSRNSVVTDLDGKFEINAGNGSVLVFSSLGYSTEERKISGSKITVVLKEESAQLENVVVTAMGVKAKSKSLGYAAQSIKASEIERPGQINALEALQGNIAGVTINRTSGAAGAGVDILIRGVSSLSAGSNNQPLIIIDGNPVNNNTFAGNVQPSAGSNSPSSAEQFAFSNRTVDINPDDIESFTVLKGAGATALYGILAGNGVIVITTKKGKEGKAKVNVSTSTTFSEVNKYPELQSKWREGTTAGTATSPFPRALQPRVLSNNADVPGGVSYYPGFTFGFQSFGPAYSSNDDATIRFRDFYRDFFQTGVNQTLNVSVSGGTDKVNYFVSGSTSKDVGIVPNTDYNRKTFKASGNYKINDKLKLGTSFTYANSGGARANTGDKSIMSSLSYWSPSIDINDYLTKDGKQKNWTTGIIDNPRYFAETSNLTDDVDRIIAAADLDWKPTSWLDFIYRANVDSYAETRNRFVPGDLDVGTQVGGFIVNENVNFRALNSNALVTARHSFNNINTSLTIGNQIQDTKTLYNAVRGEGLSISGFNNIANTRNYFPTNPGAEVLRTVGYFAEAKADYKELLYLSATARQDQVSTLPKSNNKFEYYSANLSWIFGDLLDADKKVLSFGKLRGSWAQVGKVPPFGVIGQFSRPDSNFPFAGVGGVSIGSTAADPNIRPEIVTTIEVGADLNFFRDRFRIEYTYFDRKSDDQIIPVQVAPSSSITRVWGNAGSLKTTGHELTATMDWIKKDNFSWSSIVNYTAYDTEVTSLPFNNIVFADSGVGVLSQIKVGDAAGSIYGYTWTYVEGNKRLIGPDGLPVLKREPNGDFSVSKIGNAFPDYVVTLNNSVRYKNLSLSFLLEYKDGGVAYDAGQRNGIRNGVLKITEDRNNQQVLEGVKSDGAGGFVPNDILRVIDGNSYYRLTNYNLASEILVQDASWLKLRNVALTYNFASSLLSKIKVSNASISINGGNFLLWTPFRGFDPEGNQFSAGSNTYGFTGLNVPLTQTYSIGFNIGF